MFCTTAVTLDFFAESLLCQKLYVTKVVTCPTILHMYVEEQIIGIEPWAAIFTFVDPETLSVGDRYLHEQSVVLYGHTNTVVPDEISISAQ
jgi:hypothetical protein